MNLVTLLRQPLPSTSVLLTSHWWKVDLGETIDDLDGALRWLRRANLYRQNHLVAPEDADGFKQFYVENQTCYRWAFDPTSDARPVFGRETADARWSIETDSLVVFLAQVAVYECVLAAPATTHAFGSMPWCDIQRTLAGFERVLDHWTWPMETRFYASETALAFSVCDPNADGDVAIATNDSSVIDRLLPFMRETPANWAAVRIAGADVAL
jgi:hypothetical protein